jgi:hypothetical protein
VALVEQIAGVLVSALGAWPKDLVEAIESIPDDDLNWFAAIDHARRTRDAEAALAVLEQAGYGDALRAEVDSLSIHLDQAHALLHEIAVARRGDHPDVDAEPEELPDEIRTAQRAWEQEHERADVLEAEVARLRAGGWRDLLPCRCGPDSITSSPTWRRRGLSGTSRRHIGARSRLISRPSGPGSLPSPATVSMARPGGRSPSMSRPGCRGSGRLSVPRTTGARAPNARVRMSVGHDTGVTGRDRTLRSHRFARRPVCLPPASG